MVSISGETSKTGRKTYLPRHHRINWLAKLRRRHCVLRKRHVPCRALSKKLVRQLIIVYCQERQTPNPIAAEREDDAPIQHNLCIAGAISAASNRPAALPLSTANSTSRPTTGVPCEQASMRLLRVHEW